MDNTPNYIRIAQFNIQSINSKKPLLINFLNDSKIDVCLLNETWLKDANRFNIPGYNFINKNTSNGYGGVGILIKNTFKYETLQIPFYDYLQSVAIVLHTTAGKLSILCTYCPPRGGRFKTRKLKQIINSLPKPLMLSGDLNAHHIAFGCLTCNSRGSEIYNLLDDSDMCILNTGSPTTVGSIHHNQSAIDISCISAVMAPLCYWKVHDDAMGSYHYPTIIDIQTAPEKYEIGETSEKYLYKKANWSKYISESELAFNNLELDNINPLKSYDDFCSILSDIKESCIPKFKRNKQYTIKKPVPWWDDECLQVVLKSKMALNEYKNNSSLENYIEYKKIDAMKKRFLSDKKKNSWKALCESFNRYTPVSNIWNYIRRFKRASVTRQSKNDEWIQEFLNKYAPISPTETDINQDLLSQYFDQPDNVNNHFLSQPFTWNEFLTSIKSRRDTTPGLDDITYKLIRNLHINAQKVLLELLNFLWENQCIPASWKTQCVIPILKPNKCEKDHDSYRPISLSSCVGKIFEQMIKTRLDWYVETNNILPNQQFGFRKGKCATESFSCLISDIKNSFHSNSTTVCAFLDVQGAFDNVNPSILVKILNDIGISGKVSKWIFNFLYDRTMYVKYNNILHGPRQIYKGTMQGATLSPLLYNIYTCQILQYVTEDNVQILQFADDLVLYSVNRNVNIAINNLNKALTQLYQYYNGKLKLNISSYKSSAMIFCKKPQTVLEEVLYNNTPLAFVKSNKFLGVYLDDKLSFQQHINYIIKKACKGLNILRSLAGVQWGSDPRILSMLYKSIVRSHFDYSSLAYMNANQSLLRKLDVIQNKALRIITGAMCSTPINSMECEACIPPLILRRLQIAEKFCVKLLSSKNSVAVNRILPKVLLPYDVSNSYITTAQHVMSGNLPEILNIMLNMKLLTVNIYKDSSWPLYNISYDALINNDYQIDFKRFQNKYEFYSYMEEKQNLYQIYTDGSKSEGRVTSALYDPQVKITKCFKIDNKCSIFTAEAYAIYKSLSYIANCTHSKYIIISDSQSVLISLTNTSFKYKLNYLIYKIKQLLYELSLNGKNVQFLWLASHQGILGNEIADRAAAGEHDEDHSSTNIPFTDFYGLLDEKHRTLWREYWLLVSKEKGTWYAEIQKALPAKPWYYNMQFDNRKFITTLNRMRFGHCQTRSHLHRLKIIENSDCIYCGEANANLNHVVFKCCRFGIDRLVLASELDHINTINKTIINPNSLQILLSNKIYFKPLFNYILNTVNKI